MKGPPSLASIEPLTAPLGLALYSVSFSAFIALLVRVVRMTLKLQLINIPTSILVRGLHLVRIDDPLPTKRLN